MEVETSFQPIQDNDVRLDQGSANDLVSNGLQIDFESEFSDFLSRDVPSNNTNEVEPKNERRRGSNVSLGTLQTRLDYNIDGTINCTDINYNTICQISGRPSLDRLTSLTLAVASFNSSETLSALSYCTPGLTTLRLDNSRIQSLRVLGEELHRLRTLSVCYCGLEDLDGISYAPNIVNLCAAYNQISDVYPITELRKIHTLDLENNEFEDYGSISFLFICPKLENLVLKGNPISYDPEYRPTIFRILPSLKNLDVITMKRVPRTICKKDPSPSDDNFEGPSPMTVSTGTNDFPKEIEDVDDEPKKVDEKPDPLEDTLIKGLISQKSDDERGSSPENDNDNDVQEVIKDDNGNPETEVENEMKIEEDEVSSKADDSSISFKSEELVFDQETIATPEKTPEPIPMTKPCEPVEEHKPKIMERKPIELSPVQLPSSKLLNRRKSLDPVRFKSVRRELFGTEDFNLKMDDEEPKAPKKEPVTTPTDPNQGFTPNLAKFITKTNETSKQIRPDSGMSFASNTTTSYSHSISEADSGIDSSIGASSLSSCSSSAATKRTAVVESGFPRLDARKGTGLKVTGTQQETPSKRTKKTDKAKLLRTNSDLAGKLTTEGDVEIEDFD